MTTPHTEADILIDKDVTIEGVDQAQTVVQAAAAPNSESGRVFTILSGNTVILRDFTIRHGDAPAGSGGGIWIQSSTNQSLVTLKRMTISQNRSLTQGGGIANEAQLEIDDFTIAENTVRAGGGGGIYNTGDLTLRQGFIQSNNVPSHGGGVLSFKDGDNEPSLSIDGVVVHGNFARRGGGVFNEGAMTIFSESTIANNSAENSGGGLHNLGSSLVGITNTDIINNALTDDPFPLTSQGAGIYTSGPMRISESDIRFNKHRSFDIGFAGGGLYIQNTEVTLDRVSVASNQIPNGAGIYSFASSVTIVDSSIRDNRAIFSSDLGGGIYQDGGALQVTNTTISDNKTNGFAGGIYQCGGDLQLTHVTMTKNIANDNDDGLGDGGGLFIACSGARTEIRNSIVAGNTVTGGGQYPDCNAPFIGSHSMIGDPGPPGGVRCSVGTMFQVGMIYNVTGEIFDPPTGDGHAYSLPLKSPSLAIDAGSCFDLDANPLAFDQRGAPMPVDGDGDGEADCDMGAVEFGSVPVLPDSLFLDGFE
ncbi:MAG: choice-of-anchor Q domain-containing protein [Lysobacterales bacterium]